MPTLKLTDKEKKMGDALMMTKRGKQVMDAQKRMEAEKEKADAAKRARADKLLGIGSKKGGMIMKKATKSGRALVKKSADTMGRAMVKKAGGGKCYAKGGTASARADGIAKKGKTKGKMLAGGGLMLGNAPMINRPSGGLTLGNAPMINRPSGGLTLGTGRASMASEPGMQSPRGNRMMAAPGRTLGGDWRSVLSSMPATKPTGSKKGGMVGKKKGGKC